jgi:hypothetical protein
MTDCRNIKNNFVFKTPVPVGVWAFFNIKNSVLSMIKYLQISFHWRGDAKRWSGKSLHSPAHSGRAVKYCIFRSVENIFQIGVHSVRNASYGWIPFLPSDAFLSKCQNKDNLSVDLTVLKGSSPPERGFISRYPMR